MADGVVPGVTLTGYVGQDTTYAFTLGTRIKTSAISVANKSTITTCDHLGVAAPHGFRSGQTVYIVRHVGSTPAIDGSYVCTVTGETTFTIPVNCTVAGAEGFVTALTNTIAGWTFVMTIQDTDVSPTFVKTISGVISDAANREFYYQLPAATAATIKVSATHKYDSWRTNAGTAWVLGDGPYVQLSERRVTPP